MPDLEARCRLLTEENERLREENVILRSRLGEASADLLPQDFRLTMTEARVLGALLQFDLLSKQAVMNAVYSTRPDADEPDIKIVDVFICKIRKKLAPFDLKIETVWGHGYRLTPAARVAIREMMEVAKTATVREEAA